VPDESNRERLLLFELLSQNYQMRAEHLALRQAFLMFASSVSGKPRDQLLSELEAESQHWHQRLLEKLEDENPWLAARIDRREVEGLGRNEETQPPPS